MTASLRSKDAFVLKMQERVDTFGTLDENVSSFPAVSSARAAFRDKFLSTKREATISAGSSYDLYFGSINKQSGSMRLKDQESKIERSRIFNLQFSIAN
jgi:hypothetical protein